MKREYHFWVYIVASKSLRLYTGMTNGLAKRVRQHKSGEIDGFTKRYKIDRLVYYEQFKYVDKCIAREKEIKGWSRPKKLALITAFNPTWEDFAAEFEKQIPRFARNDKSNNGETAETRSASAGSGK